MHRLGQAAGEHPGLHGECRLVDQFAAPFGDHRGAEDSPPAGVAQHSARPVTKPLVFPAATAQSTSVMGRKDTRPPWVNCNDISVRPQHLKHSVAFDPFSEAPKVIAR